MHKSCHPSEAKTQGLAGRMNIAPLQLIFPFTATELQLVQEQTKNMAGHQVLPGPVFVRKGLNLGTDHPFSPFWEKARLEPTASAAH